MQSINPVSAIAQTLDIQLEDRSSCHTRFGDTERQATSGEVTGLKREMRDRQEVVADLTLENRILKKRHRGWGAEE